MKFAAVIPAYNAEKTIGATIDSVLKQTLPPVEIFVVDDGSVDKTASTVEAFGDSVTLIRKENGGVSSARNVGVSASSAEWVAFLDADDIWLPNRLSEQRLFIESSPKISWIASRFTKAFPDGRRVVSPSLKSHRVPKTSKHQDALELLASEIRIWTGTVAVRRDAFLAVGGFDERLTTGEDQDLWFRLAIAYPEVGYIDEPLAEYAVGNEHSLTRQAVSAGNRTWIHSVESYVEALERVDPTRKPVVERFIRFKTTQMLRNSLRGGNVKHARWLIREYRRLGACFVPVSFRFIAAFPEPLARAVLWVARQCRGITGRRA